MPNVSALPPPSSSFRDNRGGLLSWDPGLLEVRLPDGTRCTSRRHPRALAGAPSQERRGLRFKNNNNEAVVFEVNPEDPRWVALLACRDRTRRARRKTRRSTCATQQAEQHDNDQAGDAMQRW